MLWNKGWWRLAMELPTEGEILSQNSYGLSAVNVRRDWDRRMRCTMTIDRRCVRNIHAQTLSQYLLLALSLYLSLSLALYLSLSLSLPICISLSLSLSLSPYKDVSVDHKALP